MNNFFKFLLILIVGFSFNNKLIACELFNVAPGSEFSNVEKIIGEISTDLDDYENDVLRLTVNNDIHCPNSNLKNTFSYIFISNKIFTGIEINSYIENEAEPSEKDNQVYTFIINNLGGIDSEVTERGWEGTKEVETLQNIILYSKSKKNKYTVESALITNEANYELTYDDEITEIN